MDTYFKNWAESFVSKLDSTEQISWLQDMLQKQRIVIELSKDHNLTVEEATSIAERVSALNRNCYTAEEMALAFLNIIKGVEKNRLKAALDALPNDELEGFLYKEIEYSVTNGLMQMLGVVCKDSFAAWAEQFNHEEENTQ